MHKKIRLLIFVLILICLLLVIHFQSYTFFSGVNLFLNGILNFFKQLKVNFLLISSSSSSSKIKKTSFDYFFKHILMLTC